MTDATASETPAGPALPREVISATIGSVTSAMTVAIICVLLVPSTGMAELPSDGPVLPTESLNSFSHAMAKAAASGNKKFEYRFEADAVCVVGYDNDPVDFVKSFAKTSSDIRTQPLDLPKLYWSAPDSWRLAMLRNGTLYLQSISFGVGRLTGAFKMNSCIPQSNVSVRGEIAGSPCAALYEWLFGRCQYWNIEILRTGN